MDRVQAAEDLKRSAGEAWQRYLKLVDGFRPDLFRYCRSLTGDLWDAEDLVQDALEQGFARLGAALPGVDNPRGYLLRIASNLWVSRLRRAALARETLAAGGFAGAVRVPEPDPSVGSQLRDAAEALLVKLAPQERAALVLKECFEMTAGEIAELLGTSEGAVKSALHRGRVRLQDPEHTAAAARVQPSREVIDRFVERYNARDLPGLLGLMLDSAAVEMPGVDLEIGRAAFERARGWFHHNFYSPFDGKESKAVWELALFHGEPVVLVLDEHGGLTSVMRLSTDDGRVSHIRVYAFCPDAIREVAAALGRTFKGLGLYRFPGEVLAQISRRQREEEKR